MTAPVPPASSAPRPPIVAIAAGIVLVVAAIATIVIAFRRDAAPPQIAEPPEPAKPVRLDVEPPANPEVSPELRAAQDAVRAAAESFRRAEEHDRRVQAELLEALARKAAVDRAKAEVDAAAAAAKEKPAPTPAGK